MDAMREAAALRKKYQSFFEHSKVTKQMICDLRLLFRDKYGLTDQQTLTIARKQRRLEESLDLLRQKEE